MNCYAHDICKFLLLQTKEIQEELAMDMKMLEQMLQETTDEAMLSQQKKVRV